MFSKITKIIGKTYSQGYCKYSLRLFSKEYALVKWGPNIVSKVHGHNGKDCTFIILNGSMDEKVFHTFENIKTRVHEPLRFSHINDKMGKHQMINEDDRPKYSFHYYY